MDKARNPNDNLVYTIDEWLKRFGANYTGRCIVCGNKMDVRAESTVSTTTHFWHSERGCICPTISKNARPYENLVPTEEDEENAIKVKQDFLKNFPHIYYKCDHLCNGLSYNEFKNLVEKANEKRIWYYKDLSVDFLPYIFLTLGGNFSSRDAKFRENSFYFVFDPNLKNFNDLWIDRKIRQHIWRIDILRNDKFANGMFKTITEHKITEFDINFDYPDEPLWIIRSRKSLEKIIY